MNGKQKRLHRYIMECSIGRELLKGELVHHINGDKFDNRIENLTITTRSEHKMLHPEVGITTRFKKKYNLDRDHILGISEQYSYQELADMFGCSVGAIHHAINGKKPRKKMPLIFCKHCGEKAYDRKKMLCKSHYKKWWRRSRNDNAIL